MPKLSYTKALNRALGDEMERDPSVLMLGEDVDVALTKAAAGLRQRFGPDRVIETPLSEQGFTNFATGAAIAGRRPVVEYQVPFLLLLVLEQIANQANKIFLMSDGQSNVPVTYLMMGAGRRPGWGPQHSDQPYAIYAHLGVKTVVPATPTDAYGLLVSAIRDNDPVLVLAPHALLDVREDAVMADLSPIPLGTGRVCRDGTDVTVVAVGQLVRDALAVAASLSDEVSIEVFDPRTIYPFDWDGLAASLSKTGRLVVCDDTNRFGGLAAEIVATATERMRLLAPPMRVTRPDSALAVGYPSEVDAAPNPEQLAAAVREIVKTE
jgi:acetoin:2,6-dichlorophenolindophenol oxidoreductase subunit beta